MLLEVLTDAINFYELIQFMILKSAMSTMCLPLKQMLTSPVVIH